MNNRMLGFLKTSLGVVTGGVMAFVLGSSAQITEAASINLIENPSVELVSPVNPNLPMAWSTGTLGNNQATFQWQSTGVDGSKSLYITVRRYVSGEAKWMFDPVVVQPRAQYTYRGYYRSNVPTQLYAQYTTASGVVTNKLLKAVPLSTTWKQVSVTFTVPLNVTSLRVSHLIKRNGYLATDNFSLTGKDTTPTPLPLTISITSPLSGEVVSGSVLLTVAASGSALQGVQYKIDGTNIGSQVTTFPYSLNWDTTSIGNGQHTLTAVVSTVSGATTTSQPVTVVVTNTVTPPPPPPASGAVNLIPNPSLETPSVTDITIPDQRWTSKIGTNDATFTYLNTGKTGSRSIKVQIANRTDGYAFYYFTPAAVKSGATYTFKVSYQSTVDTQVDAAITLGDGTTSYIYVMGLPAAAGWTEKEVTVVMPPNAASAYMYAVLSSTGELITDDYSLTEVDTTPPPPPPPAPNPNLIPNASLEIPASGDASMPEQWFTTKIGTNNAAFTYLNTGKTGSKSVNVKITNYTDGFAFYYFTPAVAVTPGKTYQFKVNYKSTVDTQVDASVTFADGTTQYIYVTGLPTSADWAEKKANILIPANAVSITIYGLLYAVGELTTDDYSLKDIGDVMGFNRGIVSLTFDDSLVSHYQPALPLMQQYGMKGTFYITTNTIDQAWGMTSGQILEHVAAGNEIGGHTISHAHLTTLASGALNSELADSQTVLANLIGKPVTSFASPYGEYSTTTVNAIKNYYQSHRSTDDGFNSKDGFDPYNIVVQNITVGLPLSTIKGWIDKAKTDKTWLVLVYHDIMDNGDLYSATPADFEAILAYLQSTGVSVQTLSDALAEVQSQLP